MLDRIHARLCWPKKNPSGLNHHIVLDTHITCLSIMDLRGILLVGITQSPGLMEEPPSPIRSIFMAESKRILNVLTLAVKYRGLDMTHGTSAHRPLARTSHMAPPNPRGPGSENLPVTGSGEMQIFGKEHRCLLHTVVICSVSQPVFSHCCFLPDSEGRHLP